MGDIIEVLMTIFQFLMVLGLVVISHEFGHFSVAKAFGIRVNEFGIGFPPKLIGIRRGRTLYTLNIIPLGGFVKLEGENDPTADYSLAAKSAPVRLMVLLAGPFMNVVLAVVLLAVLGMFTAKEIRVGEIANGSPADAAGIIPGDVIQKIDNKDIHDFSDLRDSISSKLGRDSNWLLSRGDREFNANLIPRHNPPPDEGSVGIKVQVLTNYSIWPARLPWDAVILGVEQSWNILSSMKTEVTGWVNGSASPELAGPVGIAYITGELTRETGLISLIPLAAIFSLSLAIFNVLPIPALDGGRVMFIVIECIRRGKKISPGKEALIHLVGFAVLILMIMLVTYNDITKIVEGNGVLR